MSIIIVSDIFGITPALVKLKNELGAKTIIDPYEGKSMGFNNEAEAYSCFITRGGLDRYVSKTLEMLESLGSQTTLIGFSVGASAIWRLSINNENHMIKQAFCFYGSQIRNYTKIEPCFKINVVFPISESHFDVSKLKEEITIKNNVITTQVEYLHGFMNYYSSNFNQVGYEQHVALLRSNTS